MALYDPKEFPSEVETTTDFTPAEVLAWARTKPAAKAYNYMCDRCAIGQFLVETGRAKRPEMGGTWYYDDDGRRIEFASVVDKAARGHGEYGAPLTFGAFADRLEKALS